jgi:multiple sugar transport system ATP-binding protein
MAQPEIVLDAVSKRFGPGSAALERVTLSAERGEILVVVGPSGCGKSTTLRLVAGLEEPDEGAVSIGGRPMRGVPPRDRDVAMVFQGYALYPQMTVRQILAFPLTMRGVARAERDASVTEVGALLRIEHLFDRRPAELSGGERQRVAMGRALVRKPRVFLFDEPLSNLDASLRADLRLEIGRLVRRLGVTALYVTHDHVEAMTLGDRVALMRQGRVVQVGTPREVYERPATSLVAGFLGSPRMNILPAHVDGDALRVGPFRVARPDGVLPARVDVGVRPEHVRVVAEGEGGERGEVVAVEPLGAQTHLVVKVGEIELRAQQTVAFGTLARGDLVRVSIDDGRVLLFRGDGEGERL